MKILIYVEGPSDRSGLSALLRGIIESGHENGIGIRFLPLGCKDAILDDVPRRAADHLAEKQEDWVIALPDLYPMSRYEDTRNEHSSYDDLENLLKRRFECRANEINLPTNVRQRFKVYCLKYDLEALILAAPDQLRRRLRTKDRLTNNWRKPVEDQNDEHPPKRIVEMLFRRYRKKPGYVDTADAPWIFEHADLATIEQACPQQFGPFVSCLRDILGL